MDSFADIISPSAKADMCSQVVYRLDLSLDPPVYASENDLTFATSTGVSLQEPCIISTHDNQLIYMVGGNKDVSSNANDGFYQYNISSKMYVAFISCIFQHFLLKYNTLLNC